MNQAFLQSHIQRRHPEDSHLGKSQAQPQRSVFLRVPVSSSQGDVVQRISQSLDKKVS